MIYCMINRIRFSASGGFLAATLLFFAAIFPACADEVIPAPPTQHFNDYVSAVSEETVKKLDARLAQFEKDTATQVIVAVFSTKQSDASLDDYTLRVAQAWKVGEDGKNNGIVLFVFLKDRTMRIQVGLGFDKTITDDICLKILANEIAPYFKKGDFDAGFTSGVDAILKAAQGNYPPADPKFPTPDSKASTNPSADSKPSATLEAK